MRLTGRYFTSVFVSLGVFLFGMNMIKDDVNETGYDQGVMSGIITYSFLWNEVDVAGEYISRIISINLLVLRSGQWLQY